MRENTKFFIGVFIEKPYFSSVFSNPGRRKGFLAFVTVHGKSTWGCWWRWYRRGSKRDSKAVVWSQEPERWLNKGTVSLKGCFYYCLEITSLLFSFTLMVSKFFEWLSAMLSQQVYTFSLLPCNYLIILKCLLKPSSMFPLLSWSIFISYWMQRKSAEICCHLRLSEIFFMIPGVFRNTF
jgi:hypothetical protein